MKTKPYLKLIPALVLLLVSSLGFGFSYYLKPEATKAAGSSHTLWMPGEMMGVKVSYQPGDYRYGGNNYLVSGRIPLQTRNIPTTPKNWYVLTCLNGDFSEAFMTDYKAVSFDVSANWWKWDQFAALYNRSKAEICDSSTTTLVKELWKGADTIEGRYERSNSYTWWNYINRNTNQYIDYAYWLGFVYNPPDGSNPFRANWIQENEHDWSYILPMWFQVEPMIDLEQGPGTASQMTNIKRGNINDSSTYWNGNNLACVRRFYPNWFGIKDGTLDWTECGDQDVNVSWDMAFRSNMLVIRDAETVNVTWTIAGTNFQPMAPVPVWVKNTGWSITTSIY